MGNTKTEKDTNSPVEHTVITFEDKATSRVITIEIKPDEDDAKISLEFGDGGADAHDSALHGHLAMVLMDYLTGRDGE